MDIQRVTQTTKVTVIGTEKNTYEIIREADTESGNGEEVIVIQVYPTISIHSADTMDSTSLHLQNKMKELGWNKVHMLNIFSQIVNRKPLASTLKMVDKENLDYIKEIFKTIGQQSKVIICWGNSLTTNKAANESKKAILEAYQKIHPKKRLWQIQTDGMFEEMTGTHILFLGLRHADDNWFLEEYPVKKELAKLDSLLNKKKDQEKTSEKPVRGSRKKKEHAEEGNHVSENDEQAGCTECSEDH